MGHTSRRPVTTAAALVAVLLASLAGFTLASLMTYRHASPSAAGLCTAGGCERVLASRYASIGPVPTSAFGAAFCLASLVGWTCASAARDGRPRRLVVTALIGLSSTAAAVSAALMFLQFAVIRGFCPLCTTSAVLTLAICALSWSLRRRTWDPQPATLALLAVPPLLIVTAHAVAPPSPNMADNAVVAEVAGQPLTAARMRDDLRDSLGTLEWDTYRAKTNWVERQALLVMLAKEAAAQGIPADQVLTRAVDARTRDAEHSVDDWIRLHPPPPGRDPAAARAQILSRLRDDATAQFVDELKHKYAFKSHLHPPEPRESDLDPDHLGHRLGPDDAPARLVVFSDFQCPGCADLARAIDAARQHFSDRLAITYLHFPLPIHPQAEPAAAVSECAADAGKFWPFHDALMSHNGQLNDIDLATLASQSAGLDRATYDACLAPNSPARARVARQADHAAALGLDATPALFLNGRRIGGSLSAAALATDIDTVLRGAPPTP